MFSDGSDLEFGEFYLAFLEITSLALVEDVVFFSKPKEKKVIIGRTPRSCTHVHNHVTNYCFHKNGITFSICGHFCAVKPCHDNTSILWGVCTTKTLTLTKTLIEKILKLALMYIERVQY